MATKVIQEECEAPETAVSDAAKAGNERALLEAMRDRVAQAVDSPWTPARDLAALTRRLREITKDLKALDAEEKGGAVVAPQEDAPFNPSTI